MKSTAYNIRAVDYRVREDDIQQAERFRISQDKLIRELAKTLKEFAELGDFRKGGRYV